MPSTPSSAAHALARAGRTLRLATGVSALVLLLAGVLAYRAVRTNDAATGWVAHTHEVIAQIEASLAAMTTAEAAQRAYLLAGDARQLAVFRRARGQVAGQLDALQRLTADNPAQQARMPALRTAVSERMRSLDLGLERHLAGDAAGARENVGLHGYTLMGAVRREFEAMRAEERRLLAERLARARDGTRLGASATLAASGLALVLLGLLYLLSVRHAERLAREKHELRESREQTRQHAEALAAANIGLQQAASVLEHRVERRTAALADANAELEGFARTVAHDLRAPLRNIQGYATALLEDEAGRMSAPGLEYTQRLAASAARLDGMITDLLDYSRVARSELVAEPVPLSAVVAQVLQDLASDIDAGAAQVIVSEPLPRVLAHRTTLEKVLANLVGNALKFVAPDARAQVHVHATCDEGTVVLCIDDRGIGIPIEHHDRVFEVFERLHGQEQYPGSGIGLAIVRKGVERMGGRVSVQVREQGGTRFEIRLPMADPAA